MSARDFTTGAIGRNIFLFGLPLILGNLFQQLYTFVNSAIVGHYLGDEALAAVGSVYPVVFFLVSLVIGIGSGGSVVVSHVFGAKRYDQLPTVVSTFYIFILLFGLTICVLSIVFAPLIFSLLGLESAVSQSAIAYLRVYMIGMFFAFCFNSAVSVLKGLGDSKTQLYYLIGANVLNALLSYIFVARMHLSLVSTAWASVVAQGAASVLLFIHLYRFGGQVDFKRKTKRFDRATFCEIVRIGLPTGVQQSVVSLSQILILSLVAGFGTDAVAGYSAASRIESIALLFVLNFSSALTGFAGQNFGANRIDRVKKGLHYSTWLMLWLSVLVFVVFVFFPHSLMGLFSDTEEVVAVGKDYLVISGAFWFLFSLMNIFTSFFRGVGYTFVPMLISLLALLVVRLPLSYLLSLHYGSRGIWLGAPLSWAIGCAFYLFYYRRSGWLKAKPRHVVSAVVLLMLVFSNGKAMSQSSCEDYLSPLTIPLSSSGHFAELRANHFHSGIDLRTQSKENQYVICPYDGEVSRIKIQAFGGGKNLYISHTNGYTTVYMHLNAYCGEIGRFVRDYQMRNRCYTFDYSLPKGKIKVKRGDTIALSGNTGSSGGPHLHYEIRNTASQITINPILKGLKLQDTIPPYFASLRLVPCNVYSTISRTGEPVLFDLSKDTELHSGDTLFASGSLYLAIEAYDRSNGSTARNGVFDTRVYVDSEQIFRYNNSSFSFSNARYANAIVDYAFWRQSGRRMLWTKEPKGCRMSAVSYSDGGKISIAAGETKKVRVVLTDERGNSSEFSFFLTGEVTNPNIGLVKKPSVSASSQKTYPLVWNKAADIVLPDSSLVSVKANSLYENLEMEYSESEGTFSKVHSIHNNLTPLHQSLTLKLRYKPALEPLLHKALIVRLGAKGSRTSVGGKAANGCVTASVSEFGRYCVAIDTVAPVCKAKNFKSAKPLSRNQKTIQVTISDNLSGISTYNAYVNGKWILAEYDGKSARLIMDLKDFPKGRSELKIELSDAKNNRSTSRFTIQRP